MQINSIFLFLLLTIVACSKSSNLNSSSPSFDLSAQVAAEAEIATMNESIDLSYKIESVETDLLKEEKILTDEELETVSKLIN